MPVDDDLSEKSEKPEPKKKVVGTADASKSSAKATPAPAAKKAIAPPAKRAARDEDEDDEDEDDDEWEDDEDEDEEDEPPPPPKKKAPPPKRAVAAKKAVPVRRASYDIDRPPARSWIPWAIAGMAVTGFGIVVKDFDYHPIAVLGIAMVIYAYIGVGSANEIKA